MEQQHTPAAAADVSDDDLPVGQSLRPAVYALGEPNDVEIDAGSVLCLVREGGWDAAQPFRLSSVEKLRILDAIDADSGAEGDCEEEEEDEEEVEDEKEVAADVSDDESYSEHEEQADEDDEEEDAEEDDDDDEDDEDAEAAKFGRALDAAGEEVDGKAADGRQRRRKSASSESHRGGARQPQQQRRRKRRAEEWIDCVICRFHGVEYRKHKDSFSVAVQHGRCGCGPISSILCLP